MKKIILLITVVFSQLAVWAQPNYVSGYVYSKEDGTSLFFATVNVKNTNIYAITDEVGYFRLSKVPAGEHTLVVSILGFQRYERIISVEKENTLLKVYLSPDNLTLDEVKVTAQAGQSKEGSSTYSIGKQAIKQIQPMSVGDILQLLPGSKIESPDMNGVKQADFRNAADGGSYNNANAFGTSIIVDGSPISNDANLQSADPVGGGSSGNNTANSGLDLRQIPSSNIESVEVITGVPSARYGNLTSGAVLITRKAGYSPWYVNVNTNSQSTMVSASKGFKLEKRGHLNVDLDYTASDASPVDKEYYYKRYNLGLRWTDMVNRRLEWTNTLSMSVGVNTDGQRYDPDKTVSSTRNVDDSRFMLATNGSLKVLGKLNYNFTVNYSYQKSNIESIVTDGPRPVAEPLATGTYFATYTPVSYFSKVQMIGAPLNIYGRVESNNDFDLLGLMHKTSVGMEYRYDKNFGEGRTFGSAIGVAAAGSPGSRGAEFHEIPASKTFSAYVQDDITKKFEHVTWRMSAGLRYNNMLERYHLFSPRLSLQGRFYEKVRLRAAWGLSYKTPSMLSLYPGPIYFDIINLSYLHPEESQRLAVITTNVFEQDNSYLQPGKGETLELGLDLTLKNFTVRLTAFEKELHDAISTNRELVVVEKVPYVVVDEPAGQQPVVVPDEENAINVFQTYSKYGNNLYSNTKGLELSMDLPKIKATNTKVTVSGSYLKTRTHNQVPRIKLSGYSTPTQKSRYGVYDNPAYDYITCRTNATLTQQIPKVRMIISLVAETNWAQKKDYIESSLFPVGYYDGNGDYVAIPEALRDSEEYADLTLPGASYTEQEPPIYSNFHLQLRKETRQGHSISFYANNFLWHNPSYTNELSKTKGVLNGRISFGMGLSFKL